MTGMWVPFVFSLGSALPLFFLWVLFLVEWVFLEGPHRCRAYQNYCLLFPSGGLPWPIGRVDDGSMVNSVAQYESYAKTGILDQCGADIVFKDGRRF